MWCDVVRCDVMWCGVMWCDVTYICIVCVVPYIHTCLSLCVCVICCTCIYIQCDPTSWNYPCFNLLLFWCFLCGRCVSKCLHHQLLIVSSTAGILPSHINCKSRIPTSKGLEKPTYTSIYLFMGYIISIYCIYSHNSSQGPSNQHLYIHTRTNVNISHTNLDCTWNMLETGSQIPLA